MKLSALAFATLVFCSPAIAQAAPTPTEIPPVQTLEVTPAPATKAATDTKLPAVSITEPVKKDVAAGKWFKCDLACRMKTIAETLEKEDCRQDMVQGFNSKRNQAIIMRLPSKEHLVARVEKICIEDYNKGEKMAEDLRLDESAATETETDKPAVNTRLAGGGYGHGPRFEGRDRDRNGGKYRSFENVAEDSYTVRAKGKDFNLRNVGNGKNVCEPPRQLVRSERCVRIGGGGIRCQFDCL